MAEARRWAAANLETGDPSKSLFSFAYGGKPSAEFLGKWDLKQAAGL